MHNFLRHSVYCRNYRRTLSLPINYWPLITACPGAVAPIRSPLDSRQSVSSSDVTAVVNWRWRRIADLREDDGDNVNVMSQ